MTYVAYGLVPNFINMHGFHSFNIIHITHIFELLLYNCAVVLTYYSSSRSRESIRPEPFRGKRDTATQTVDSVSYILYNI